MWNEVERQNLGAGVEWLDVRYVARGDPEMRRHRDKVILSGAGEVFVENVLQLAQRCNFALGCHRRRGNQVAYVAESSGLDGLDLII